MKPNIYNLSKKLSWYDHLSIDIDGVKVTRTLLDWYREYPCAILVHNIQQKGPWVAPAVYAKFTKHRNECGCKE